MKDDRPKSSEKSNGEKRYKTLADVARALRIDPSTVSLVLSGSNKPSAKTRERVLAFCEKVSFRPNLLAQGLSKGKSGLWGVLFPDIRTSFFPGILEGIEAVANEVDATSFLALSRYNPELMRSQILAMQARYVDGLLIVPTGVPGEREIIKPCLGDTPTVFLVMPLEGDPLEACVHTDAELGGFLGAEHLASLGHKRIGFLAGPPTSDVANARRDGWLRALRERGIRPDMSLAAGDDYSSESGYRAMNQLLELRKPPTAVLGVSDYAALGAMEALLERGLQPGEQVAVVGYDDICCGHYSPVPLTTVSQPKEELGEAAARALVEVIKGNNPAIPVLKPNLVIRSSCGGRTPKLPVSGKKNPAGAQG